MKIPSIKSGRREKEIMNTLVFSHVLFFNTLLKSLKNYYHLE